MRDIVFHIGYHKTGTTWLQEMYFPLHPSIRLVGNPRRPWDVPFLNYIIKTREGKFDPGRCEALLREEMVSSADDQPSTVFLVSSERLSGHPFSGGYDSFRIAERIRASFTKARILCVLRNQVDMIHSIYKQFVSEGYPGDLHSLLFAESWKTSRFDLDFYEYDILLRKYRALFGPENVCALSYERMVDDMEAYLRDICTFIRVPYQSIDPVLLKKRLHKTLPAGPIRILRRLNYFRKTEYNPVPFITMPAPVYSFIRQIIRKIPPGQDFLDPQTVLQIKEYYKASNSRLREIVTTDFSLFIRKSIPET